jgi:hypothetical protein
VLTLRYVPEVDDIVDLLAGSPERGRRRDRALRNLVLSLVLLCGVLALTMAYPMPDAPMVVLFCAAVSVLYLLRLRATSSRRGLRRRAGEAWHRSPVLRQPHEEEISPEGLTQRTEAVTSTFAWSLFSGFTESDRQFVLVGQDGEPLTALPKRGLPDPSLVPACRDLLTEYLAAARAHGRRPDPAP